MSHSTKILLVAALCAVFLAGAIVALMSGDRLRYPDELEYHDLGISIARGDGMSNAEGSPTAKRPPGWPFALSVIYRITERPLAAKFFNVILLTAISFLIFLIARISQEKSGIIAIFLIFIFPIFYYISSTLYTQVCGSFLFILSSYIILRYPFKTSMHFLAGLVYGLLILTTPAFLLVSPIVVLHIFYSNRKSSMKRIQNPAIFIISLAVVVAPWTIRNYLIFNMFIPVSSNSGINLFIGNSEKTTANSGVNILFEEDQVFPEGLDEIAEDKFFREAAVQWIKENPQKAFFLYWKKALNYFNYRNQLWNESESSTLSNAILFFTYYPLLFVALFRFFRIRKRPLDRVELFLFAMYFGNALVSAVFFTRIRFRIPFDFLLIGIVAIFLASVMDEWSRDGGWRSGKDLADGS